MPSDEDENKQLLNLLRRWADGYDHTTPIDEPLWDLYTETRALIGGSIPAHMAALLTKETTNAE